MTVGGDKLEHSSDISSPVVFMLETKLLINSVISDATRRARILTADLKDYFLQTIMIEPEFVRIQAKYFPEDIQKQYNIKETIAPYGYVYCKIKRGGVWLKHTSRLAWN